ncbi:3-oxoadipate enol-lactonase [Curtobacterium sp. PhB130]|uniref:alpha/beta fold hydrolase n=1 Tax=Curtobacterium sp. PhB130 TaxID=2485178 RepID=UPI000F4C8A45|nr:alpha/beta fold hydrolase [Curtobacterium sp. PhB130]ROS77948.1 3-oxoadipate enol-lactonase [Curtobacterium sp. PhB130]
MVATVVALPGTLCPPAIFDRLAVELGTAAEIDAVPWLTEPGPRTIAEIAESIARRIGDLHAGGPVLVCGHSTGGAIAMQLALEHPDLVSGVLLVDTGAHMGGHGDVAAILRRVDDDWGEDLRAAVLDRSFADALDPMLRREWLAWASTVQQTAVRAVLASQAALDLRARLPLLTVPTSIVHGARDRARSVDDARELARLIPGARLTIVDSGHSPVHETPGEVAVVLQDLDARVTALTSPQ